ncbi:MAG: type II secretion system F family protein [Puniceicoccales bacterium]|jgi:type IV pilus assembly protein PilC|nr:type II secretion system F family protein [Puniceicoccales bacterium]
MVLFDDETTSSPENEATSTRKKGFFSENKRSDNEMDSRLEKRAQRDAVKLDRLTIFAQQLSSMLQAGLPLSHALETITAEMDDKVFKLILTRVKENIFSGSSFSDALRKYPNAFPSLFYNMVEAGEVSGALPDAMVTVSNYFEASLKLTKKFKSALTYPIAIVTMSFLLVSGLMIWVVPVFGEMFSGFGARLPWLTQALIDVSQFMKNHVVIIVGGIVSAFVGFKKLFRSQSGAKFLDATLCHVPLFGTLIKKTNIARFCRTYSVLLSSGVPILKAIDICTNVADSFYLSMACTSIKKGIQEGQQLSTLMESIAYFPRIVCNMTKAGEQAGNVEGMIRNVAVLYENDVNNIVSAMTSLLEPFIICFLGVVIGVIVIAMFLPIFQLSSLVG